MLVTLGNLWTRPSPKGTGLTIVLGIQGCMWCRGGGGGLLGRSLRELCVKDDI